MKIHLVAHTPDPAKAIAAAFLNMGIGMDTRKLEAISNEQAADALSEIFKSHLMAPLSFASFNFFWEDIPLFMRAHLVRHNVGCRYAERSLRFYDANLRNPTKDYDWDAMPSLKNKIGKKFPFEGINLAAVAQEEMERQMQLYSMFISEGVSQEDARNFIGVWYPTALQTTFTYEALRNLLADRLSSQAHAFWQKAAYQIKTLITGVSPLLGEGLVDSCQLAGRCVWNSRFDRDCEACIRRGLKTAHEHIWNRGTSFGPGTQCDCGVMKPLLLEAGQ